MGVPALFRWLSKKYPKIVAQVVEDTPIKVLNSQGEEEEVPVKYEGRNPNGFEVDNLYLDMNGIVHPCTHPEGREAPETEEEMMVEIFKYTERVVNMARPRKVLMMAIDGVAPRAKMNQQRSRRFRAAQDAADKEEERKESILLFEAMGHPVSEETRNKKSWDSNAITPGTPFMDLLSASLKYWISHKLTTDPGWRDLKIIISDASVPGEGEHKIVDWIRRQRTHPTWDPNTSHVMYGLDADLIMLSLATHEPHFRVLREDVFTQGSKGPQACRKCGEMGHLAVNCKGEKKEEERKVIDKAKPIDPKPFIFLDVSILREYLTIELNVPHVPFPFNLELAIDDWIFMIFFVGNDFLPHLPSLEIREGAIDALLKIWRAELPRMGGYLTDHGKVDLGRAQVILEGLAKSEDGIFQRRKEDEERQENNQKRRRIEEHSRQDMAKAAKEAKMNPPQKELYGSDYVAVTPATTARGGPLHPTLPSRPGFDIVPKSEIASSTPAPTPTVLNPTSAPFIPKSNKKMSAHQREVESLKVGPEGIAAMQGSNADWVKNRKAIRMANLSAAERLKAELEGRVFEESKGEDGGDEGGTANGVEVVNVDDEDEKEEMAVDDLKAVSDEQGEGDGADVDMDKPEIMKDDDEDEVEASMLAPEADEDKVENVEDNDEDAPEGEPGDGIIDLTHSTGSEQSSRSNRGSKRSSKKRKAAEEAEDEDEGEKSDVEAPPDIEADQPVSKKKVTFKPDGTVEGYVDTVRLWEPGYRERYYEQKFGKSSGDTEFVSQLTKSYMEGLCWVLEYYYQGVPAWDWYYPYHYAPFAQDFKNVGSMKIEFEVAEPFKPFAQLLGVFPAASRVHLPLPLQGLMTEEDSPIIDFYPGDFDIDMNGKKMAWQGVALLPFIDQHRLLTALKSKEEELTDDEKRRNRWGDNVLFVSEGSRLYDPFCGLYGLKAASKPVPIDNRQSQGITGSVLADNHCVPNSGYDSPLPNIPECPDIPNNASLSVRYYFPRQVHSHRSTILQGYRPVKTTLSESDKDWTRRGGHDNRGGYGGGGGRGGGRGGHGYGGGPGMAHTGDRRSQYPPRELASYGVHSGPPPPRGYGGNGSGYAPPLPPPIPAGSGYGGYGYGGSAGGGYAPPPNPYAGAQGGYGNSRVPQGYGGSGGGYGGSGGGYAPPPPTLSRGTYGAYPPPPPPSGGYGGGGSYGGGGGAGYGGGGSRGGGYNPYGGQPPPPPRRY